MSAHRLGVCLLVLMLLVARDARLRAASEDTAADEQLLREAGVGSDAASLLAFFRLRTPSEVDSRQIDAWIRQLGSDQFALREEASRQLVRRGALARPMLQAARHDADREIARRVALALEEIDNGPGPALPTAAVHVLAQRRPAGATSVLLAYLPFADDEGVVEEILDTLLTLTPEGGPFEDELPRALTDARPQVRGAAAYVLGCRGDTARRTAVRRLLRDADASVRWRAGRGLLTARERSAMTTVLSLLEDAPLEVAGQAEDMLYLLAGDQAPSVSVHDAAARRQCREAWQAWWTAHGDKVDLARVADRRQLLGLTLGIEFNTGRVWECGRDGTLRWELTNLAGPMDAQVLPGNRVLVVESHGRRLSVRTFKGDILWEKKLNDAPSACQRLPSGNIFVASYGSVREFDRDGKSLYDFRLPSGSNAVRKHRNGHIIYALDKEIVEIDTAGNRVRSVPLPPHNMYVGIQDLPGDHFLVANSSSGRVLEVDAHGKIVWEGKVAGACGVWRVPSGNTLVATNGRVVELDRRGQKVWEVSTKGYVRRVHRR
jgi:hypothetical protein